MRQTAQSSLIPFSIAINPRYQPNWHHEVVSAELEHIAEHGDRDFKILLLELPPRHGKLCSSDTLVPTPKGFKTHGSLRPGDAVFHPSGKRVTVKRRFSGDAQALLRVTMTDGSFVDVHPNHEWTVHDRKVSTKSAQNIKTVETREIAEQVWLNDQGQRGSRARWQLPDAKAVQFDHHDVPVDAYTLGCWLGDGSAGKPCLTLHPEDRAEIVEHIPYAVSSVCTHKTTQIDTVYFSGERGIGGELTKGLQELGVYKDKAVPAKYLVNSELVRRELLAGIIDTDGSVGDDGRIRVVNANKTIIEGVQHILHSLGYRTTLTQQNPTVSTSGVQGTQKIYTLAFTPHDGKVYAKLNRKNRKIGFGIHRKLAVASVEPLETPKPGQCIEVDASDGLYLVTEHYIPTHNSELATINFPAWLLGKNPDTEIITASYSGELAQDFGTKTRTILTLPEYQHIFSTRLKDDEQAKAKWQTAVAERERVRPAKGSYTSVGVGGPITGRGANVAIVDDPLKNREEAESQTQRDKIWDWFTSTLFTRLEPNGVVVLILTRWHLDDVAGRILEHEDLSHRTRRVKFPAIAEENEKHRNRDEPLWPEKYELDQLNEIKSTIGIYDWTSLYQQRPVHSETQEFKQEMFKYRTEEEVRGHRCNRYLTVDTAISEKDSADYTAFCDNRVDSKNYWNLMAWRTRYSPHDLIDALFTLHQNNQYDAIGIEKTVLSMAIMPFLQDEMRRRNRFLPIVELSHKQVQKETRIRGLIPRYGHNGVYHVTGQCNELEEELLAFPKAPNDDIADATAYQLQLAQPPNSDELEAMYRATRRRREPGNPAR